MTRVDLLFGEEGLQGGEPLLWRLLLRIRRPRGAVWRSDRFDFTSSMGQGQKPVAVTGEWSGGVSAEVVWSGQCLQVK